MSTDDFELGSPPAAPRARELWLQHAAGFILFEDVRKYALERIDPSLDDAAQKAARKAIDDALYGLMMVIDGVTGALANGDHAVTLTTEVRLVRREGAAEEVVNQLDLRDGDGMCMGHHGWIAGDFGSDVVAVKKVR